MLRVIRDIVLFLFIFSAINDNLMADLLGGASLKVIYAIFILINLPDIIRAALHTPENIVMKSFYVFISLFAISALVNVAFLDRTILIEVMMPVISILVVFTYFSYYKNFDKLLYMIWINVIISAIVSLFNDPISLDTFRRSGGTVDPVEFCIHLFLAILVTIFLYKKNKNLIFLIGSILLFLYAMLYTGSKTAVITFSVLILYAMISRFGYIFKYIFSLKGVASLAIIVGLFIQLDLVDKLDAIKGLQERAKSQGTFKTRVISWEAGYGMIQDNFFTGVGQNQYMNYTKKYLRDRLEYGFGPHNIFVMMFSETGVFSFLSFIVFLYFLITTGRREVSGTDYFWISLIPIANVIMGLTLSVAYKEHFWLGFALWSNIILRYGNKQIQQDEKVAV